MPGSKCQIVVLAGKTGHFTDIIKNKKRGGKQMNKTPKINRLFLVIPGMPYLVLLYRR